MAVFGAQWNAISGLFPRKGGGILVQIRELANNATGFGLFFALNLTAMWLDIMPFVPASAQSSSAELSFFIGSCTLEITLVAFAIIAYRKPSTAQHLVLPFASIPYLLGMGLLEVISFTGSAPAPLWGICGLFLGWGTATTFVGWQLAFSLQSPKSTCPSIVLGTMGAAVVYIALDILGASVASSCLIALMVVAEVALLARGLRARSSPGPTPESALKDDSAGRSRRKRFARDYWRTASCIGILGFCTGAVRTVAATTGGESTLVNIVSMAALFCVMLGFFLLWNRRPLTISTTSAYRAVAPVALALFAVTGFLGMGSLVFCSGMLFALMGCLIVLIYLQSLTAADKRDISHVFAYAFFSAIVWVIYDLGHVTAVALGAALEPAAAATQCVLLCACLLGGGLFLIQGGLRSITSPQEARVENLDLLRTAAAPVQRTRETSSDEPPSQDSTHTQVQELARRHDLTAREAEVAELIVRGFTVRAIAERLTISENTVRTHSKGLYRKLDIHKKADLADVVSRTPIP